MLGKNSSIQTKIADCFFQTTNVSYVHVMTIINKDNIIIMFRKDYV